MVRLLLLLGSTALLAGCGGTGTVESSRRVPATESASAPSSAPVDPHSVTLPPKRIATH
jgi:hypothetical protein